MTLLIHLWRRKALLGLKIITASFCQPFIFSLSSLSLSLLYSSVSLASRFRTQSFPSPAGCPRTPQQHDSAPSASEGWFLVAFLLCHLAHVSQLNFHSVLCQVWRFVLTKPLYTFKGLTFDYKQHLLFVSC